MLALVAPLLLTEPLTAGPHTLDDRTYHVWLPTSPASAQAPVAIILHGRGGTGQMGGQIGNDWPELKRTHIIVGPDGPDRQWNVKGEYDGPAPPAPDDAYYVGKTLIDHLATYSNVDATSVKLVGFSNGAALSNRINIENEDARITHILTDSSQLNTYQYRGGHFYRGGGSNQYDIRASSFGPRAPRKVLAVVGGRDLSVPAEGGESIDIENGEGGMMTFVQWEESARAIATAYGYTGAKAALSPDDAIVAKASYLSGQVVAVNVKNAGHVVGPVETAKVVDLTAFLAAPLAATAAEDDEDDIVDDNGASRPAPSALLAAVIVPLLALSTWAMNRAF